MSASILLTTLTVGGRGALPDPISLMSQAHKVHMRSAGRPSRRTGPCHVTAVPPGQTAAAVTDGAVSKLRPIDKASKADIVD
jgi:hypothetical protein